MSAPPAAPPGRLSGQGFPRILRLRRSADFTLVNREGRKATSSRLVVLHRANGLPHPRFGMAVSRKVGNAVVRNRVKRLLREAIRKERALVADRLTGQDVVLIARTSAAGAAAAVLRGEVAKAFSRIWGGP